MMDRQTHAVSEQGHWQTASELPDEVFAVLRKPDKAFNLITIVATVNPDGTPHTAPFGSLRAFTSHSLRLICFRHRPTYANLCRDGRVKIAVLAPPNIAVSIRGRARIIEERMDASDQYAIIGIDIEEVKNDMVRVEVVEKGKILSGFDNNVEWLADILDELEGA
jgi:hypothetical protein